jgi:hypothetical protein
MGLLKTLKRAALSDAGFVALLVLATITRGYYGYYNAELPPVTGYPMHVSVMIATGRGFVERLAGHAGRPCAWPLSPA